LQLEARSVAYYATAQEVEAGQPAAKDDFGNTDSVVAVCIALPEFVTSVAEVAEVY
jgi:hypothetical protein